MCESKNKISIPRSRQYHRSKLMTLRNHILLSYVLCRIRRNIVPSWPTSIASANNRCIPTSAGTRARAIERECVQQEGFCLW
jgi:hypothetical protein